MNTPDRKMYKILCPMERGGRKWWMSLGMGFTNRDASINLHLDAVPVGQTNLVLQLREYTEEDQRLNAERRASFSANRGGYTQHSNARHSPSNTDPNAAAPPIDSAELPFHPSVEPLAAQSLPF